MASTYNLISTITFILAAIFFLLSVFLFFKFNIIKISGDLSGRNAKKSISEMKKVVSSIPNENREVYDSVVLQSSSEPVARAITTEMDPIEENATDILNDNMQSTTVLNVEENGTTVLNADEIGTTVLSTEQLIPESKRFIVIKEITFIHV